MNVSTYRNPEMLKYPFCPGCGHGVILDQLNAALVKLQLDPRKVVIVTDIGCVGMSDPYFSVHTFHGLHGRSIAYATGIKLADPALTVIVLIGDGGCGIGGHHLLNAARRNIGITVLVFNNFNYGMTGGEHSVTTPYDATTADTRGGNLERPLDICATAAVNGGSFVYRGTQFDKDLADRIAEAIRVPGFSLLDIWELCTAYYVPNNEFSKAEMYVLLDRLQLQTGLIQRQAFPEFASAYHSRSALQMSEPPIEKKRHEPRYSSNIGAPTRLVLAGSAGGKVRSAASTLARAAMLCGLWCTQRDDYPTTVMSGHSISELILSPTEILYTGIKRPDMLALLSPEAFTLVERQIDEMDESGSVWVMPELADRVSTRARKIIFPEEMSKLHKKTLALAAVSAMLRDTGLLPIGSLEAAICEGTRSEIVSENLKVVKQYAY